MITAPISGRVGAALRASIEADLARSIEAVESLAELLRLDGMKSHTAPMLEVWNDLIEARRKFKSAMESVEKERAGALHDSLPEHGATP